MTRPDPISRLAVRCMDHPTLRLRDALAEATMRLARSAASALVPRGMARRCDAPSIAVDAAAWCVGSGLRRYDPSRSPWAAFVANAVRREAARISRDEARQAKIRRRMAEDGGGAG